MLIFPQAVTQLTMRAMQVVAVLVTLLTVGHAILTEYFVTPNESTPCPAQPCHTLSHYLENTTHYFTSNTRISFLHGLHKIKNVLWVKGVSNLTLTGYNVSSSHAVNIMCLKPAILGFRSILNLVVKYLSILYCGYPVVPFEFEKELSNVAVLLFDINSLTLSHISVGNSTGYGVMGKNVLGTSSISHSKFMFNNYYILDSTNCSYACRGGNMYLHFQIPSNSVATEANNVISIDSCVFSNGVDLSEHTPITPSSGLSMFFYDTVQYKVNVSIRNVIGTENIAEGGANFLFYLFGDHRVESIKIMNITSSMANCLLLHENMSQGLNYIITY